MSEEKKSVRRPALPKAALKRLLLRGAGAANKVSRCSDPAAKVAKQQVTSLLKELGSACLEHLTLLKKKTLTMDFLKHVIKQQKCNGVSSASLVASQSQKSKKGKVMRDLSEAGVLRVFKGAYGKDHRIDGEVKKALLALANNYVVSLGQQAGNFAGAVKRQTLKSRDLDAAKRNRDIIAA